MYQPANTEHGLQACIEACSRCHQVCLQTAMNHYLETAKSTLKQYTSGS
jgi:hypothetical protein